MTLDQKTLLDNRSMKNGAKLIQVLIFMIFHMKRKKVDSFTQESNLLDSSNHRAE